MHIIIAIASDGRPWFGDTWQVVVPAWSECIVVEAQSVRELAGTVEGEERELVVGREKRVQIEKLPCQSYVTRSLNKLVKTFEIAHSALT